MQVLPAAVGKGDPAREAWSLRTSDDGGVKPQQAVAKKERASEREREKREK